MHSISRRSFITGTAAGLATGAAAGATLSWGPGSGLLTAGTPLSALAADASSATESAGTYKDSIEFALEAQPPTLDTPTTVSQVALDIALNFYEPLITMDENYETAFVLAKSLEINDSRTEFVFELKENVSFHDGHIMNADDVVASMNYWLANSSRARTLLGDSAHFSKQDDLSVVCTLDEPSNDLVNLMKNQFNFPAIRTADAINNAGDAGVTDYNGTGPYQFVEWKQDQYIKLERFDGYHGVEGEPSGFAGRREAKTPTIMYRFVSDSSTIAAGLETGQYDITENISADSYSNLKNNDQLEFQTQAGGTMTMFMNIQQGPTATLEMRQAIAAALNMDEIMLASMGNEEFYLVDPGYMDPAGPWANDAGSDVYNQQDLDKARQLLQQAGYNNEQITLLSTPDYPGMYNASLVVQAQLLAIGVNAVVDSYDFPTFMERKNNLSNWSIFITSNSYQMTPQQLLVVNPDWAGNNDETVQDYVDQIKAASSDDEAHALWKTLQAYLYETLPCMALGQYQDMLGYKKGTTGLIYFGAPILWNAQVPAE